LKKLELLCEVESYFYYDPLNKAWKQRSLFFIASGISGEINTNGNPDLLDESGVVSWYNPEELNEGNMQDYGIEIVRMVFSDTGF